VGEPKPKKPIKPWREFESGEIEAARELYQKYGPSACSRITREMIDAGWRQFRMSDLAGRYARNFAGLIEMGGWDEEWLREHAPRPEPEPRTEPTPDHNEPEAPTTAIDFPTWLEATRTGWTWRWRFQRLIYKELDKITRGDKKRLMIFMPPRHGKSELVTVRYAAWRLARDPALRIVVGSYNQRLANRFSRYIKAVYRFGPHLAWSDHVEPPDLVLNTVDEWETADGGGVKAVGVGAGITGFGADLIIIDDPVKSRADAESKNNRERVWEWFTDDLLTRLEPNGAVILIQTRWHEDDLAGRLIKKMQDGGEQWEIVRLPALSEPGTVVTGFRDAATKDANGKNPVATAPGSDALGRRPGEALWPERFDVAALERIREQQGSYSFAALYQQTPVPAGGALFKREWFSRIVGAAPEGLRWFRGYDLAVSTKTAADYTASFRCALDKRTGDLYIADGFRARLEFPDQRKYIVERIREERDTEHGIEEALHGQAFVQELWREEHLSRHAFRGVRVTTDKFTRALAWANRAEAGHIVLVRGPWIDAFLDEVCHFPNSAHDDQVDAVSLAVQMMDSRKYKTRAF
jgi:predicted phage terminase large subunit-like protein